MQELGSNSCYTTLTATAFDQSRHFYTLHFPFSHAKSLSAFLVSPVQMLFQHQSVTTETFFAEANADYAFTRHNESHGREAPCVPLPHGYRRSVHMRVWSRVCLPESLLPLIREFCPWMV
jgi:hypothetical protein